MEDKASHSFSVISGRRFRLGDKLRVRGVEVVVSYLDGEGGLVVQAAHRLPPGRYRPGTVVSLRGRTFVALEVNGTYLSLKGA